MKKWLTSAFVVLTLLTPPLTFAQSNAEMTLARKVVALQNGDELKALWNTMANAIAVDAVEKWQTTAFEGMSESKQVQTAEKLDAELQKLHTSIYNLLESESAKVENDQLARFYAQNFTTQELNALIAWFESPTFKKYQQMSPQIAKTYMDTLMQVTSTKVKTIQDSFDKKAQAIIDAAK